jgi:hypothetical protein
MFAGLSCFDSRFDSLRHDANGMTLISFRSSDGDAYLTLHMTPEDLDELFDQIELSRQVRQGVTPEAAH